MATKTKKTASYDLKGADRRRNLLIQVGLIATVVIVAVVLIGYIVLSSKAKPTSGEAKSVRVASSKLITKDGSTEPKVVVQVNEDFLCPVCRKFEGDFGPTVKNLIDTGAAAVDYDMVAILSRPANKNYSSRASAAAYCVADEDTTPDKQIFSRFHNALFAQQPSETGKVFPSNADLIETARQSGAAGSVPGCVNSSRYIALADGLAEAVNVQGTPTIRINGEDFAYDPREPVAPQANALVAKVKAIVGDVPGLAAVPAGSVPPPQAPQPPPTQAQLPQPPSTQAPKPPAVVPAPAR